MSGSAIGSLLTARLSHRSLLERLFIASKILTLLSILTLMCVLWSGQLSEATVVVIMEVYVIGNALGSPTGLALVMAVYPCIVGSATKLIECVHMLASSLCAVLATVGNDFAWADLSVMVVLSLILRDLT